jgi:putative NADPH-quinone reductase
VAHPNPNSFNQAIADTATQTLRKCGHSVYLHDLYTEKFDAIMSPDEEEAMKSIPNDRLVLTHCQELADADGIIIVHPNWWGMPPAILKGWVDRVVRQGVAYKFEEGDNGEGIPIGLLKAKSAVVFNTSNTPEERENNVFGDPLENLWRKCIFEFCGVTDFHRRMFRTMVQSTPEQRLGWLEEVKGLVCGVFCE